MSTQIRVVSPREVPDWNARVGAHDGACFFHSAEWAETLRRAYGFTPVYVAQGLDEGLAAVLPVMEVSSLITGRRGIALPFTDYCEPLHGTGVPLQPLVDNVMAHARRAGWRYIEFRGRGGLPENAVASDSYVMHRLELGRDAEALFARLKSSVRRAIRKAQAHGVAAAPSTAMGAMRDFYRLNCVTRRGHGLPPQPYAFFRLVEDLILSAGLGTIVLARLGDRVIAGAVFFRFGRRGLYKYGASDPRYLHLRANNLVMWEGILWCLREGCDELSMGRTALANEGLRRYKLGWGTQEQQIDYHRYDLRKNCFTARAQRLSGWQSAVFAHLPVGLSRLAGALMYRHVA